VADGSLQKTSSFLPIFAPKLMSKTVKDVASEQQAKRLKSAINSCAEAFICAITQARLRATQRARKPGEGLCAFMIHAHTLTWLGMGLCGCSTGSLLSTHPRHPAGASV